MNVNLKLLDDSDNSYVENLELNLEKLKDGSIRLRIGSPERRFTVNGQQLLNAVTLLDKS